MESGKFFALDTAGAPLWMALVEGFPESDLDARIQSFCSTPEESRRLRLFEENLRQKGLLETNAGDSGVSRSRGPSAFLLFVVSGIMSLFAREISKQTSRSRLSYHLEAYLLMCLIDVLLAVYGFSCLYGALAAVPKRRQSLAVSVDDAKGLSVAAENAFRWYRPGIACMHRALEIFVFLQRHGLAVEFCLGIRASPFASHAWAEYEGNVLGDQATVNQTYRVIAKLGQ